MAALGSLLLLTTVVVLPASPAPLLEAGAAAAVVPVDELFEEDCTDESLAVAEAEAPLELVVDKLVVLFSLALAVG